MNPKTILISVLLIIISDLITGSIKKSPPYLIAPFVRLWKETIYLRNIIHNDRFIVWGTQSKRYVALQAVKAKEAHQDKAIPVIELLKLSIKDSRPVILLGEPGVGKTTSLQVLTYHIARHGYIINILLWVVLIFVATSLIFVDPTLTLIWLFSFFLFEFLVHRNYVPLFIEARSDYLGGEVKKWRDELLKQNFGDKPLFGSFNRVVWIMDGVNEIVASVYPVFIEGWRAEFISQPLQRIIFSSREREQPTIRIGQIYTLNICDLNDDGVLSFLSVYGYQKAPWLTQAQLLEQARRDFKELRDKKLLTENGVGRNPYWLKMIVESGLYTRNRGLLFRNFSEKLIHRETEEKPEERKKKPDWKIVPLKIEMDALAHLAFFMQEEGQVGIMGEEKWNKARAIIREGIGDLPFTPDDVLGEAEAASLVRVSTREHIEFVHQLVQEFFVALFLKKKLGQKKDYVFVLKEHPFTGNWDEVLIMLAGIYDQPSELVQWLAEQTVARHHVQSVLLTYKCYKSSQAIENPESRAATIDALIIPLKYPSDGDTTRSSIKALVLR